MLYLDIVFHSADLENTRVLCRSPGLFTTVVFLQDARDVVWGQATLSVVHHLLLVIFWKALNNWNWLKRTTVGEFCGSLPHKIVKPWVPQIQYNFFLLLTLKKTELSEQNAFIQLFSFGHTLEFYSQTIMLKPWNLITNF